MSTPDPTIQQTPEPPPPRTPEEKERHWFEHVYAGDRVPQLTLRSVLMGTVIGCVMAFSNLYVGLKAGWGLSVAITACIISYTVFALFHAAFPSRRAHGQRKFLWLFDRPDPGEVSILENNCMQSTASSAGYSTASTLVSAFPAFLLITGRNPSFWSVAGLVLGTGLLGVFLAVPMKRTMINIEQLPFPSGTAAAETLRSLHGRGAEARKKARGLFWAMGLGAALAWLRDGIPAVTEPLRQGKPFTLIPNYLPISQICRRLGFDRLATLTDPAGYTLTLEISTVFAAAGAIMGIRTAASMALGAIVNYGVLAPRLHDLGIIQNLGYRGIISWSVWGGASLMTCAALVNFFMNWRTVARAFSGLGTIFGRREKREGDPMDRIEVPGSWFAIGVVLTAALVLVLNDRIFGIPVLIGSIAIVSTALLSVVASRATGETDTTPLGALGKITQLLYGVLMPQNITANLMTANITASSAATSADLLTDLKSGYLLGANPRKQFLAQFLGVFSGTLVATWGYFQLVPNPSAIGGDKFPAPAAQVWKAVAEILARGFHALPSYAPTAMLVGAILGIGLTLLERSLPARGRRWVPSPIGFGMAFTFQGYTAMAFFLGGIIAWAYGKRRPQAADVYTIPVASGFIAGETLMAVAIIALQRALGTI
ncbi:MAG TPA: OPT family oligopeptide transporter [Anaeromyxobacter sp.]|nr:OPT family oligopeptide transporter [Anaeromyxobacter sp.]